MGESGSVFISHTVDMATYPAERSFVDAAVHAVLSAKLRPVDMAYFPARGEKPAEYCQRLVRECDVYVALVGFRYGRRVPDHADQVSYTELEFLTATEAGIPRLVFVLDEQVPMPAHLVDTDRTAVDGFRARLYEAGLLLRTVTTPAEVAEAVLHSLYDLRLDRAVAAEARGPARTGAASYAAVALVAVTTVVLGLATNMASGRLPQPWRPWAWLLLLLLTAVAAILARGALSPQLRRTRTARDDDLLRSAASRLAQKVRAQWAAEATTRDLWRPHPLRVRWSPTRRPVAARPSVVLADVSLDRLVVRLRDGDSRQLVSAFRGLPRRQAVLLGEPGSGKTVLSLLFTLGLLDPLAAGEPVPVLLSLSSWNPNRENLQTWFSRRLVEDYPFLTDVDSYGPRAAHELVNAGLAMPVLDGLDEMPVVLHRVAIEGLDHAFANRPFLVTCRSREYENAVAAGRLVLSGAAVAELEPVRVEDTAAFLAATPPAAQRWRPVLDHIRDHRDGALARAFSTPLMVALARSVYRDPTRDPAELLSKTRFPDSTAVEEHLLDELIPVAYRDRPPPPQETAGKPQRRYRPDRAGRWHAFLAHCLGESDSPDLAWWRLAQAMPHQLGAALAVTNGLAVGLPLGLWLGTVSGSVSGLAFGFTVGPAAGLAAGIGAVVGGTVGPSGPNQQPRSLRFGLRGLGRLLSLGVRFGLPVGVLGALTLVGPLLWSGSVPPLLLGLTVTGAAVLLFGLVLEADTAADDRRLGVTDPRSVLRSDRAARLVIALLAALISGFALAASVTPGFGLAGGASIGLASVANSTYGRFVQVRLWLAGLGRLPLRLMRFLDDAHDRDVLRRVGAVYQFRHDHLRRRLAASGRPGGRHPADGQPLVTLPSAAGPPPAPGSAAARP